MTWHYAKDGEQKGPVTEEELKQLFESGQISSSDLVWKEGMAEWSSYGSVFQDSASDSSEADSSQATPIAPVSPSTPMPATSGTGGNTPNPELRARALNSLKGQWAPAIGVVVVCYLLIMITSVIPLIGFFAMILLTGPMVLGLFEYFLRRYRDAGAEFSHLFAGFSNFPLGLVLYLLLFLIGAGASLVAAIPGGIIMVASGAMGSKPLENPLFWVGLVVLYACIIVVSVIIYLFFTMSFFIAVDEPGKGAVYALKKSPAMVEGKKGKLFMMYLVFYGWSILTILTLGIGMLWVAPYCLTSMAAFYDDLKEPAAA